MLVLLFKQKTAYEMRISDWSSDVGSSDLKVRENEWIALPDGTRLAARLWLPETAERVPAVLEFLPYRKRAGTAPRAESTYPVFAAAGYAGVRVDMRGSGDSEGVLDDEYSTRELADACAVIARIGAKAWCSRAGCRHGLPMGGFTNP